MWLSCQVFLVVSMLPPNFPILSFLFFKLQAKQWQNKQKRQQERNDEKRQTAGTGASDDGSHNDGQDCETDNKTTSSVSILDKNGGSVVPHHGLPLVVSFIQWFPLRYEIEIILVFWVALENSLLQTSNARDRSFLWVDRTAKSLIGDCRIYK